MKDKAISFIIWAIIWWMIVFGYSHFFSNQNKMPGWPGWQRPNFNHQRSGSWETLNSWSGQTNQTTTTQTTTK